MSNHTTHYCDRCGEISNGKDYLEIYQDYKAFRFKDRFTLDLCKSCFDDLIEFMSIVDPKPLVENTKSKRTWWSRN
jgi:hypothetical protein